MKLEAQRFERERASSQLLWESFFREPSKRGNELGHPIAPLARSDEAEGLIRSHHHHGQLKEWEFQNVLDGEAGHSEQAQGLLEMSFVRYSQANVGDTCAGRAASND